jgi:hypothetical protein
VMFLFGSGRIFRERRGLGRGFKLIRNRAHRKKWLRWPQATDRLQYRGTLGWLNCCGELLPGATASDYARAVGSAPARWLALIECPSATTERKPCSRTSPGSASPPSFAGRLSRPTLRQVTASNQARRRHRHLTGRGTGQTKARIGPARAQSTSAAAADTTMRIPNTFSERTRRAPHPLAPIEHPLISADEIIRWCCVQRS